MVDDEGVGDLADWLTSEHARLPKSRRGTQRYVAQGVDAFLAEAVALLRRGELPEPSWVRNVQFFPTMDLRRAYDAQAVDDLLDLFEARLMRMTRSPDLTPDAEALMVRVLRVRFSVVRAGYDLEEVDTFLEQAAEVLANGGRPAPAPPFATARRRGYDRRDVDAFLDELRRGVEALDAGGFPAKAPDADGPRPDGFTA